MLKHPPGVEVGRLLSHIHRLNKDIRPEKHALIRLEIILACEWLSIDEHVRANKAHQLASGLVQYGMFPINHIGKVSR